LEPFSDILSICGLVEWTKICERLGRVVHGIERSLKIV